ncbi:MAG: EAL domain-containing protein [Gammaproteobacteria bacterium]|nr:EAL domain-containing protein [Gammaproteobacteria bacterium]
MLLIIALSLLYTRSLAPANRLLYDAFIRFNSQPPAEDIVIVAVDEKSMLNLGRWPWSRRYHAALINKLDNAGAKAIGLSIIFSEPDISHPEDDLLLEQAIRNSGKVILPVVSNTQRLNNTTAQTMPIPQLIDAAARLGHVDIELDGDGIARSVFLHAISGTTTWSSFGLAMKDLVDGITPVPEDYSESDSQFANYWTKIKRMLIPYVGPPQTIPHISYLDVLEGRIPDDMFLNKYVIVGVTAHGMGSYLATPASHDGNLMPGVEVNANILNAVKNGNGIFPMPRTWVFILAGLLTLLPVVVYPRLSPRSALVAMIAMIAFTLSISFLLLTKFKFWFPSAPVILSVAFSYPLWSWRRLEFVGRSMFEHKQRSDVTLEAIGDAVITTNKDGIAEYLNPAALQLTHTTQDEAVGHMVSQLISPGDSYSGNNLDNLVDQCIRDNKTLRLPTDTVVINNQNRELAIIGTIAPIHNDAGKTRGAVVAISDVTEMRDLLREMEHQANHDVLTGLPNRILLRDRLERSIVRAKRTGRQVVVLFADLDGFKTVNDGLGHLAGDKLLKAVSERLRATSREEDTIARIGGDEFVILLENISTKDQIETVTQKIVSIFEKPFIVDRHELFIGASIGVSVYPKDGEDHENLLNNADTAMYRAKAAGRNSICYFGHEMSSHALKRLVMEQELRRAIYQGDLVLFYQPLVSLITGRMTGVEALVRWQHPERGLIQPGEFIPLAEETGLILPLGEWVLKTACQQAKEWKVDQRDTEFRIAINLSPRQFLQSEFPVLVEQTLEDINLSAQFIEFEITENHIMQDIVAAKKTMEILANMGIGLSIDDFGTGYSSLSYLNQFPIARLKIDRSFVQDINSESDKSAIALAVIAMAHSMNLSVIAEGVEKIEQLNFLKEKQCDEIQGFYLCQPIRASEVQDFYADLKAS